MLNRHEIARNALRAFEKTGATLPAKVREALDNADTIRTFITEVTGTSLSGTIVAALRAGNDPATDPDVTAATMRAAWSQPAVLSSVQSAAENETVRAVTANADAMIAAMTPLFDAAVAELEKAHQVLGDVDLRADHQKILALGSKAATAWAEAIAAVEVTNGVTSAWGAIARTAGVHESLFATATVEWDAGRWVATRHDVRHHQVGPDAWAATRGGWTLRLANRADLREFEAAVATAEQQARDTAESRLDKHAIFNR